MEFFNKELAEYVLERCTPVPPSTCWFWLLSQGSHGYGQGCWNHTVMTAPRLSHMAFVGDVPAGLWILHSCHNRLCVNPDHLRVGTPADNGNDTYEAGHSNRKLTDDQVREIRYGNVSSRKLAKLFGVGPSTIKRVRNGRFYRGL